MKISQILETWYLKNRRMLPWRLTKDPYKIWISEIMLQQTTVAAVIPYFERFIRAFPDVKSLAKANEEKVLSLWSGLGYYSRARNLQKAAKAIIPLEQFPNTYDKLIELPGVGPYTAAAIASIAFDEEVAAIDGNVIRVISRLFDLDRDVSLKETQNLIHKKATDLIQGQNPSVHNQAMMELGATLCIPKNPTCLICPVHSFCQGRKNGTILERPVKTKIKKSETWVWHINFVKNPQGKIALVKSENGTPWLNHLWVLPGKANKWEKPVEPKAHFKHAITHHKIYVQIRTPSYLDFKKTKNIKWMSIKEIQKVGISSIVEKALKHHDIKVTR